MLSKVRCFHSHWLPRHRGSELCGIEGLTPWGRTHGSDPWTIGPLPFCHQPQSDIEHTDVRLSHLLAWVRILFRKEFKIDLYSVP